MSDRTYVVTKENGRFGEDVIYAGQDAGEAVRLADDLYVSTQAKSRETYIHVWEGGEHQFVTRQDPRDLDR